MFCFFSFQQDECFFNTRTLKFLPTNLLILKLNAQISVKKNISQATRENLQLQILLDQKIVRIYSPLITGTDTHPRNSLKCGRKFQFGSIVTRTGLFPT